VPDGRAGKTIHDGLAGTLRLLRHISFAGIEELTSGLSGENHLSGGTLTDTFGITVTPDVCRKNALVALVDIIAGGLADEVRGDCPAAEVVLREEFPDGFDVARLVDRADDVEVITPTGKFDAFVTHSFHLREKFGDFEVGPLAGEESDWTL
jgi:hypothetical protein